MKHGKPAFRMAALALTAGLLLPTAAQALTLEQARALISSTYMDPVSEDVLGSSSIEDMLAALGDPYTEYFTAEEYQSFLGALSDTVIVGIGVVVDVTDGVVLIERVLEDTPAQQAGIQAGDEIVSIDGKKTAGQSADTVSGWLRDEEGTTVQVTLLRGGKEQTVDIIRRQIVIAETSTTLQYDHVAVITCNTFGEETAEHFREGITAYDNAVTCYMVDLRENGGGMTKAATDALGCFIGAGVTGYIRDNTGAYYGYTSTGEPMTIYPTIVLVGASTASAAEMFSAAIRDYGNSNGIVVGSRTYGKGTAQVLLDNETDPDYFTDGDAMKISAYRFFSPMGSATDTVGVIPHLLVDESMAEEVASLLTANITTQSKTGLLRIDYLWRWYVDLDVALAAENRAAFSALLEALPDSVAIHERAAGAADWSDTSRAGLGAKYAISYTDRGFTDCDQSPYADCINTLATFEILQGNGDGAYQPEKSLTRAEFAQMLAQALNCTGTEAGTAYVGERRFSDVPADAWYAAAVNKMAQMGLMNGVGDERFDPDAPMSHAQFITIMGRVTTWLNSYCYDMWDDYDQEAAQAEALTAYPSWAQQSVWLLAYSQINILGQPISLLWDEVETIAPDTVTTREEAAALLYAVLSYTGILPV